MEQIRVVLNKATGRVVYACHPSVQAAWEGLWPPAAFSYFSTWVEDTVGPLIRDKPWSYRFVAGVMVMETLEDDSADEVFELDRARALALVDLTRGINRHRRSVTKPELHGQDLVYMMKREESVRYVRSSGLEGLFPMLTAESKLLGISIGQVATTVIFRATQADAYLVESETQRRMLTTRVLEATTRDRVLEVQQEILEYARRY